MKIFNPPQPSAPTASSDAVPLSIQAHKAESDRLGRLTEFLAHFAPAIGESKQTGSPADDVAGVDLCHRRDTAIADAYEAVARISRMSFTGPRTP